MNVIARGVSAVLAASAMLSACSGSTGNNDQGNAIVLKPETKILDQPALDSLMVSADRATLSMSSASAVAQTLGSGDVLPIGITAATPRGMLRKVTAVSQTGGQVVVTTTQATLADTFKQAHFALHSTLGPGSFSTAKLLRPGVRFLTDKDQIQARLAASATRALTDPCAGNAQTLMEMQEVPIAEDESGSIKANGEIEICPSFDFDWDIGGLPISLKSLTATATLGGDIHVTVTGNYDNSFDLRIPIATLEGDPIPVSVAGVPLVVVPEVTFFIGAKGEVTASFSAGAAQASTVTGGITYSKATGIAPVFSHTDTFAPDAIVVGATLSAQGNAGVTLKLLVDEIAAVELSPHAFEQLDADISKDPWWTLSAGFDVPGKVSVTLFGIKDLADFDFPDTLTYSTEIDHAGGGAPAPTISLTADPTSIIAGQSTVLTWLSTETTSCAASGGWTGSEPTSGTASVSPVITTVYALSCTGGTGTANSSVTVTVSAATKPTVTFSADPASIAAGQSSTLTWSSTNATSCTASGGWSGSEPISGTAAVSPAVTTTYTLSCAGTGGSATASTTVTVAQPAPSVSITADALTITAGQSSTLSWASSNATSCTATGGWTGTEPVTGTISVMPAVTTTYTLTCSNTVGSASNSVTITVTGQVTQLTTLYSFGSTANDGKHPSGSALFLGSDGNFYGTTNDGGQFGKGAVFSVTPTGSETLLHSFADGADGSTPLAGVIQGGDGFFYGTTSKGGAGSAGTVFKVASNGTESVVFSFPADGSQGAAPYGGLTRGNDGQLYGTTIGGGAHHNGVIFRIATNGSESLLHSFGSPDAKNPEAELIVGSDGNFYGTSSFSDALVTSGSGTIFKITPAGAESVLYAFNSNAGDANNIITAVTQGNDGSFYGTGADGGLFGHGAVYKVTSTGVEAWLYSFTGGDDGAAPEARLFAGTDGNFYGTTTSGGKFGEGTIFKITPAGAETVVYSFGASPSDGSMPVSGLVRGNDGNLYGTTNSGGTFGLGTVFKLSVPH